MENVTCAINHQTLTPSRKMDVLQESSFFHHAKRVRSVMTSLVSKIELEALPACSILQKNYEFSDILIFLP